MKKLNKEEMMNISAGATFVGVCDRCWNYVAKCFFVDIFGLRDIARFKVMQDINNHKRFSCKG